MEQKRKERYSKGQKGVPTFLNQSMIQKVPQNVKLELPKRKRKTRSVLGVRKSTKKKLQQSSKFEESKNEQSNMPNLPRIIMKESKSNSKFEEMDKIFRQRAIRVEFEDELESLQRIYPNQQLQTHLMTRDLTQSDDKSWEQNVVQYHINKMKMQQSIEQCQRSVMLLNADQNFNFKNRSDKHYALKPKEDELAARREYILDDMGGVWPNIEPVNTPVDDVKPTESIKKISKTKKESIQKQQTMQTEEETRLAYDLTEAIKKKDVTKLPKLIEMALNLNGDLLEELICWGEWILKNHKNQVKIEKQEESKEFQNEQDVVRHLLKQNRAGNIHNGQFKKWPITIQKKKKEPWRLYKQFDIDKVAQFMAQREVEKLFPSSKPAKVKEDHDKLNIETGAGEIEDWDTQDETCCESSEYEDFRVQKQIDQKEERIKEFRKQMMSVGWKKRLKLETIMGSIPRHRLPN